MVAEVVVVVEALSLLVVVGLEILVLTLQIRPDEAENIPYFFAVEVNHAPQSMCVKDDAPENISSMLITLDTSHLDTSLLKDDADLNI